MTEITRANVIVKTEYIKLTWVRLERYCDFTGDKEATIKSRMRTGAWLDDQHYRVKDRRVWINLEEAQAWVAAKDQSGSASSRKKGSAAAA